MQRRPLISCRQSPIPRIVDVNWVLESWREKTVLSEERAYLEDNTTRLWVA
jgi:hypothetical protein